MTQSQYWALSGVCCVQNDTVLFSMKVRDLDYGSNSIPNLNNLEQITCFSGSQFS